MWVPQTPAPAILRACSVKHRQELSCLNLSKTTINYIISGIILPADSNTIHRYVQKCLSQRHGGTEVFFEIFIVGSCDPVLHETLDINPDFPTLKPDAYDSHLFSAPLRLCGSILCWQYTWHPLNKKYYYPAETQRRREKYIHAVTTTLFPLLYCIASFCL